MREMGGVAIAHCSSLFPFSFSCSAPLNFWGGGSRRYAGNGWPEMKTTMNALQSLLHFWGVSWRPAQGEHRQIWGNCTTATRTDMDCLRG